LVAAVETVVEKLFQLVALVVDLLMTVLLAVDLVALRGLQPAFAELTAPRGRQPPTAGKVVDPPLASFRSRRSP
jgi:hypothetical protein